MILPAESVPLAQYSLQELLILKRRITELLPASKLEDIDIQEEIVLNYRVVKEILDDSADEDINKRAAVANTLTAQLKQIAELQKSFYNASRLQKFERALATVLKDHPDLYKAYVEELNK